MTQYIDKSTIVLEIEKLKGLLLKGACASQISMQANCKEEAYNEILSFISTLEVKEVDLEKEIDKWICDDAITHEDCSISDVKSTAKHFFELGISVNNKAQKGE